MASWLTARRTLAGYAVWMAVLTAASFTFAGAQEVLVGVIDVSGTAGIVLGVARNSPARRAPWLLLGGANLTGALGLLANRLEVSAGASLPFSTYVNVIFLAQFPLYAAGLVLLARTREAASRRRGRVDSFAVVIGLALLGLLVLVAPDAARPDLGWTRRLLLFAYPVGDLIVLAALGRLLTASPRRNVAVALTAGGLVAGIASTVAYAILQASGTAQTSRLLALGSVLCYIALGAAGLHPSMAELTRPAEPTAEAAASGVVVLVILSMVPPLALLVYGARTRDPVDGIAAVTCGVLFLLMLSRLWDVAASYRRSLVRERTLRVASSALASATSVEEVAGAVKDAAEALVPGLPTENTAILAVREGGYLRRVNRPGVPGPANPLDPVGVWLQLSQGRSTRFVSMDQIRAARHGVVPSSPAPGDAPPAAGHG
jgi:hypothetical protein